MLFLTVIQYDMLLTCFDKRQEMPKNLAVCPGPSSSRTAGRPPKAGKGEESTPNLPTDIAPY